MFELYEKLTCSHFHKEILPSLVNFVFWHWYDPLSAEEQTWLSGQGDDEQPVSDSCIQIQKSIEMMVSFQGYSSDDKRAVFIMVVIKTHTMPVPQ